MQLGEMGQGAGRVCFPWVLEAAGLSVKQIDNDDDEDKSDVIVIIVNITAISRFYFSVIVNLEPN